MLGARLGQLRARRGIDLPALSRLTEIPARSLAEIEKGLRLPDRSELIRLACGLDVLVEDIAPDSAVARHSDAIYSVSMLLGAVTGRDRRVRGWWLDDRSLTPSLDHDDQTDGACTATKRALRRQAEGMAHLKIDEDSLEIAWNVDRIRPRCLALLSDLVSALPGRYRVRLTYYKSGWATESHRRIAAALARINTIVSQAPVHLLAGTTVREVSLSRLPETDLFSDALLAWRADHSAQAFQETWMANHAIAFHRRPSDLVYSWIGARSAAAGFFGRRWRSAALGRPSGKTLPDRAYDRNTSRAYGKILDLGMPRFDHVLANIERDQRDWTSYHRLTLPCEQSLICLVELVPLNAIDIPFLQRRETAG